MHEQVRKSQHGATAKSFLGICSACIAAKSCRAEIGLFIVLLVAAEIASCRCGIVYLIWRTASCSLMCVCVRIGVVSICPKSRPRAQGCMPPLFSGLAQAPLPLGFPCCRVHSGPMRARPVLAELEPCIGSNTGADELGIPRRPMKEIPAPSQCRAVPKAVMCSGRRGAIARRPGSMPAGRPRRRRDSRLRSSIASGLAVEPVRGISHAARRLRVCVYVCISVGLPSRAIDGAMAIHWPRGLRRPYV